MKQANGIQSKKNSTISRKSFTLPETNNTHMIPTIIQTFNFSIIKNVYGCI